MSKSTETDVDVDDDAESWPCFVCGEPIDDSDAMGAEIDGSWQDVCRDCYDDAVEKCQLCGEDTMPRQVSEFILVKAELGNTAGRPPGVYRVLDRPFLSIPMIGSGHLHASSVLFIDKLPKFDREYDISGHVCKGCAKPYATTMRGAYGRKVPRRRYPDTLWPKEQAHTRAVVTAHPEMLRDLECDPTNMGADGQHLDYASARPWRDLQQLYNLPDGLPTYHELLFVEHRGVKVFATHELSDRFFGGDDPGWLALSPEPRFRRGAGRIFPQTFTATSLPTYEGFGEDYSKRYYRGMDAAYKAVIRAIEQGLLRQDGCYDAAGKAIVCR